MTNPSAAECGCDLRSKIAALALDTDTGSIDDYCAHFADHAVIDSPGGRTEGRADIAATATDRRRQGLIGPDSGSRHHVIPGVVTVDGDQGRARSTFAFYMPVEGKPVLINLGEYLDEFLLESGHWLLVRRQVTFG